MNNSTRNSLVAFGLVAALQLTAAQAQVEHDDHHRDDAPSTQNSPQLHQPDRKHGEMMNQEGMDHDRMMQMHEQHMGQGMNHGNMGKGQMQSDKPVGPSKGPHHDH
ncbi:hypothetical protein [Pseudomonas sp. SST3]|uniref:hypothetical protein n=1 Tax=Pseudomonas sp. SST3 TaxID=2267882 RepID=UPI000E00D910|nr:hypothetical protein [Pseudomonas sp. SST3]NKQ09732.1 hypothetical protein [Pseudomonas sp. SST3]